MIVLMLEPFYANFTERIGTRGTIEWPTKSLDFNPCDFGMWRVLKEKVFTV